jgi:hypothetical protein
MFKRIKPLTTVKHIAQFPHCDQRILYAPGECEFCDRHKDWQELRVAWGISFTGYEPEDKELPCPADFARGDNHKRWYGNVAKPELMHNHLGGENVSGCPACAEDDEIRMQKCMSE